MRFLLIEDESSIRAPLAANLREAGYAVDEAASASEASSLARSFPYDALVVDVRLPEGDGAGFDLVRALRADGVHAPVLFLTARDAVEDRIAGLDAGGDDYLVKPFHVGEVQARLRALVRRARAVPDSAFLWRDARFDWNARAVYKDGARVPLTAKEYALIEVLASNPGRVFTKEELIDRVWDGRFEAESNVVETYVRNVRRKLGDDAVRTTRGLGYSFPEH
ncbi:response regulator transcription factor [Deinococcus yavapaiensis]|uniref:Two-component system response regulator PhoP n=1 Tax=Deinococcus yavapaiensis KR-236 TaxID=694435 RepID=A0A318SJS6_9DEIO|nr:response regulator transcription factor [Deinococcus yavapaiensis]PYE54546.1 two-component system response regulator PhoP [Deinococcus yavapaiensis KR-236]